MHKYSRSTDHVSPKQIHNTHYPFISKFFKFTITSSIHRLLNARANCSSLHWRTNVQLCRESLHGRTSSLFEGEQRDRLTRYLRNAGDIVPPEGMQFSLFRKQRFQRGELARLRRACSRKLLNENVSQVP